MSYGGFFASNRSALSFLFLVASEAVLSWCKNQGFTPGICAVMHTFGSDLKFHPHIHILLTLGGLGSDDGTSRHKSGLGGVLLK